MYGLNSQEVERFDSLKNLLDSFLPYGVNNFQILSDGQSIETIHDLINIINQGETIFDIVFND